MSRVLIGGTASDTMNGGAGNDIIVFAAGDGTDFVNGFTQGWLDSYQVQIVPFIANAFSIFLFYQFFQQ